MNKNDFVNKLLKAVPEFQPIYEENRKHSDIEIWVILGDLKKFIENLVNKKNKELLQKLGSFISSSYGEFDEETRDTFFASCIQNMDESTLNYLSEFLDKQILAEKTKSLKNFYKPLYEIDGENFSDLEGFYKEFNEKVFNNETVVHNLDALNDVLRGGFGTPEEGFRLFWHNSERSRKNLKDKFDVVLDIFKRHKDIKLVLE